MQKIILYLSLFLCIGFTACSDDEDDDDAIVKDYLVLNVSDFNLSDGGDADKSGGKYWSGTYSLNDTLKSQVFTFSHTATDWVTFKTWNGFTLSNSKDDSDMSSAGWYLYQWSNMAGGSSITNMPYVIAYWDFNAELSAISGVFDEEKYCNWIKIDNFEQYTVEGVSVTNTSWGYYAMMDGASPARKFEKGDYLALKIYGVKADGTITDPVVHYLADYRSSDSNSWTVDKTWKWVDLKALGQVKYIYFQMESTDVGEYGINTPMYFCLEGLTLEKI